MARQQVVWIVAEMEDGSTVEEVVEGFPAFLDVWAALRRDPACRAVRWYLLGETRSAA